jgi:hypothetical protein
MALGHRLQPALHDEPFHHHPRLMLLGGRDDLISSAVDGLDPSYPSLHGGWAVPSPEGGPSFWISDARRKVASARTAAVREAFGSLTGGGDPSGLQ